MRQNINNNPADSGLGDSIKVAFDKTNNNFIELYDSLSGITSITKTSELINDGSNGTNEFISVGDSIPMSAITGLITSIQNLNSDINNLSIELSGNTDSITTIQDDINAINSSITDLISSINTQNGLISGIQSDIADIYNIINNL